MFHRSFPTFRSSGQDNVTSRQYLHVTHLNIIYSLFSSSFVPFHDHFSPPPPTVVGFFFVINVIYKCI